jgi:hypothetical protein
MDKLKSQGNLNVQDNPIAIANQKMTLDRWPFIKRSQWMWNEAMTWYPAFKELAKFCNPTRGYFIDDVPNRGKQIDFTTVVDGHARIACRTLASGMHSGLTAPSRPWFKLELPQVELDNNSAGVAWLDEVQERMLEVFAQSNIYGVLRSMYEEIGTFGTACAYIEEDADDVIRGRVYTAGEYFLSCGPDGRVNGFHRRFWMTNFQLVEQFGIENCSPRVQAQWQTHQDQWTKVNLLIEPNDDRIPEDKSWRGKAYRCVYWEDGSMNNTYLYTGGYDEFPIIAPRWDTTTTMDIYGRGPGWDALGNVKMLQKEQRDKLTALALMIRPPMQVDSSIQGEVNLMPGGVTRSSSSAPNAGVRQAFQINPDIRSISEDIQVLKQTIDKSFFADLFLMLDSQDQSRMTATEVAERQSEKLQILGPVLERLENELLNPLIERTFAIMMRGGLIPPPPPELSGLEIKPKYISILAQAQRMVGVTSIDQWVQGVGMTAQLSPDAVDIVNFDEVNSEKAEMLGIPAKVVRSTEELAKIRQQKAQAQQQQMQMQQAMASAKAAKDGTGAISQAAGTEVQPNNALQATLGAITGRQ